MCRVAKEEYYNVKCRELEELDRVHSNLLYDKIKEFQPKAHKVMQQIKSQQGVLLHEKEEVLERWAEYVEELYEDASRGVAYMGEIGRAHV